MRTARTIARGWLVAILLLAPCLCVHAHAPDTSYLRAVVSEHTLVLRFTFDLATLHRIVRLDADNDGKVSRTEAEAAVPVIAEFLEETITLELNGRETELGKLQSLGWPVDAGEAVEEKNYGQTLVHFTFSSTSPKLIEDIYLLYEVFAQLGAQHRVIANIEQEEKRLEVVFTQFERDYVYDTFWREGEPLLKFRDGVEDSWRQWWLPCMMAILAAWTARWRAAWYAALSCLIGIGFWILLTLDPDPLPRSHSWAAGMAIGLILIAIITVPVRMFAISCRAMGG